MSCEKDILRIVRGNAFAINIAVEAVYLDGTPVEDFDLRQADPTLKLVRAGNKIAKDFSIEGNSAVIDFDGNDPLGWCGIEMYGTFEEKRWRFCVDKVFQIVETNDRANIPSWTFLVDSTYFMTGVLTLSGGAHIQADWTENDPENPAYIKHKPDIDGKIADAVNIEKARAQQAEQTLQNNIDSEAQARQQADTTIQGNIDAEKNRSESAEGVLDGKIAAEVQDRQQADQTLDGKIGANTQAIATEKNRAEGVEAALQLAIDIINGKIPAQASVSNQLADKDFVNSSISTATAEFKGTYNSLAELEQVSANANDYAFVVATDAAGNTVYKRYKWVDGTGWVWEYDLNNSSFTAAQWAAIQSGITAALVTKLTDLPTNAELNQRISTAITTALGQYYTKTEIDTALANINTAIGQKASQADLTAEVTRAKGAESDLQQLIQQVSSSLVNYCLKSETYSKTEVNTLLDAIKQFRYEVAVSLPTASAATMGIIYLIPSSSPEQQDIKVEYLTILDGSTYKWEKIGSTAVDLSGYSTTAEMNAAIASALTAYYTKTEVDGLLAAKQNTITDNAQIGFGIGTCTTAAATAAKVVSITGFTLKTNGSISVRFTNGITSANSTLNVNNTGAKPIFYNNEALKTGYVNAGDTAELWYDGTNWVISSLESSVPDSVEIGKLKDNIKMIQNELLIDDAARVIMTSESNPEVFAVCYAQGWCKEPTYMTYGEAQAVTDIGTVFSGNTNITHFEELQYFGVTSFSGAFASCSNLTSLGVPPSLLSYSSSTTSGCNKLHDIYIMDVSKFCALTGDTTYNGGFAKARGSRLYLNNRLVSKLVIPDGITSLGDNRFDNMFFDEMVIPFSVKNIGTYCFLSANITTLRFTAPIIADYLSDTSRNFADFPAVAATNIYINDTQITGVYSIPNDVTVIGAYAFAGFKITSVNLHEDITTIGDSAFAKSTIQTISLPSGCVIWRGVFNNCTSLTGSLVIPNTTYIYQIQNCQNLSSVDFPATILDTTTYNSFGNCFKLKDIYVRKQTPVAVSTSQTNVGRDVEGTKTLYVPAGSESAYQNSAWYTAFVVNNGFVLSATL